MNELMVIFIAAALGWSLSGASLCGVAATQEAMWSHRATGLYLQVIVLATTAVTLLGLSLWIGDVGRLPGDGGSRLAIIAAAAVMAVGALINGGCYLGSVMYLGRGRANFLLTLFGIWLSARSHLVDHLGWTAQPNLRPQPSNRALGVAIAVALMLLLVTLSAARREAGPGIRARLGQTVLAGVFAGALMVHAPGWNYAALLNALANLGVHSIDFGTVLPAVALFAGAIAGTVAAGHWAPTGFTAIGALRCLTGGFIMDSAARAIPGGNDVLLLWTIPGLGGYGLLAYSVLVSVLLVAFRLSRPQAA